MSQFNITQLLGISFPTDIGFGDVKPIPNSWDINPKPFTNVVMKESELELSEAMAVPFSSILDWDFVTDGIFGYPYFKTTKKGKCL